MRPLPEDLEEAVDGMLMMCSEEKFQVVKACRVDCSG
jgi:hypothetical protein